MMTTTNFKVGQKVVCVRSGEASDRKRTETVFVYKEKQYTIKDFGYLEESDVNIACHWVELEEVEGKWGSNRFRPLAYSHSISATLASTCLKETQIETSDTPIKDPSPKPEKEIA